MKTKIINLLTILVIILLATSCHNKKALTTSENNILRIRVMHVSDKTNDEGNYGVSLLTYASGFYVSKDSKDYKDILSVLKYSETHGRTVIITTTREKDKRGTRILSAQKIETEK